MANYLSAGSVYQENTIGPNRQS